jgi:hypothetical protein
MNPDDEDSPQTSQPDVVSSDRAGVTFSRLPLVAGQRLRASTSANLTFTAHPLASEIASDPSPDAQDWNEAGQAEDWNQPGRAEDWNNTTLRRTDNPPPGEASVADEPEDDGSYSINEPLPEISGFYDEEQEFDEPAERPDTGGRSYYIEEHRYTPSQFRRLSRSRKVEAMVQWFHENYEDPAVRLPYESAEGGYQWIYGGPYDAHEVIGDEFSDVAGLDQIEAAVTEVTSDGLFEWAPTAEAEDYDSDDDVEIIAPPDPRATTAGASFVGSAFAGSAFATQDQASKRDAASEEPTARRRIPRTRLPRERVAVEGLGAERREQLPVGDVLTELDRLAESLKYYQENLPPRNHNHPPELVEPDPISPVELQVIVKVTLEVRVEIQQAQPDPVKLEAQAFALRRIATSIAAWMGRKADLALDSTIKWGAPIGAAWMFAHPENVSANLSAVADLLSRCAQYLNGTTF